MKIPLPIISSHYCHQPSTLIFMFIYILFLSEWWSGQSTGTFEYKDALFPFKRKCLSFLPSFRSFRLFFYYISPLYRLVSKGLNV
jgi:hypothetical protein